MGRVIFQSWQAGFIITHMRGSCPLSPPDPTPPAAAQIVDKALEEPKYSSLYAQLCLRLAEDAPNFDGLSSEIQSSQKQSTVSVEQTLYHAALFKDATKRYSLSSSV